jgi:hypothetical protein
MKWLASFLILSTAVLSSCGSSSSNKGIDGPWNASLVNPDQSAAFTYITVLAQGTGSTVNVTSFSFSGTVPCFASSSQAATFSVTGHSSGFQTGPFTMTISTMFPQQQNNVLTLTGTRGSDGTITGTWSLAGLTGCSGNGTFSMSGLPPV